MNINRVRFEDASDRRQFLLSLLSDKELRRIINGRPEIEFKFQEAGVKKFKVGNLVGNNRKSKSKRRVIGHPNKASKRLHRTFRRLLRISILWMRGAESRQLLILPSATAFKEGTNPTRNAHRHVGGNFFYILDVKDAYRSVDLTKLSALLVYIFENFKYGLEFSLRQLAKDPKRIEELTQDKLFPLILSFLKKYVAGTFGEGLAVGGVLSPLLFNLYMDVFLDSGLRALCEKYKVTYTRFADDLVFSREKPIFPDLRKRIRSEFEVAGVRVNHNKSFVLSRGMGSVFVTKVGISCDNDNHSRGNLLFPQKKRRQLHGIIKSYIRRGEGSPYVISGLVAEFINHYRNTRISKSDEKTYILCQQFKIIWERRRSSGS